MLKNAFEEPSLEILRFEMEEALTSDVGEALSGLPEYEEGVGEW